MICLAISSMTVLGQKLQYLSVPELEKILKNPANKLFVVNFWATWCPPCVKEIPSFEKVSGEYDTAKVKFIMVSLDFPSQIEKQLIPYIKKHNLSLKVAVMLDIDYNSWIDKVDISWQGEIPATLIFNNNRKIRYFHSGEFDESMLKQKIDEYL
jgi:thiol-disulfide isomerase/thioredoxin